MQGLSDAWNVHGGHGFAENYSEDADFVNIYGMYFSGKPEIEERHVKILQTFLKGTNLKFEQIDLREVQPGCVIATARWDLDGVQKALNDIRKGIFTFVFVKNQDKGEITAARNTLIKSLNTQ